MEKLLQLFIGIPLLGYVLSLFIPEKKEDWLSGIAFACSLLYLLFVLAFTGQWINQGWHPINLKEIAIFTSDEYEFLVDFYFDRFTAVYSLVGGFLLFVIVRFSRVYLHRESGYKRFFNTILFFFTGYNIAIFSGNFETLFIGWEILGISSFLLIAFYRERILPVQNALKVFFIYRIGDIGLILAMWLSHHLWHENISFAKLNNAEIVHHQLLNHSLEATLVSLLVLIAAYAKSAQLPFSSWLPRAMEGPTPSSAIFYGSLSVHIGAFLLIRIFPFYENQWVFRAFVIFMGAFTSLVASMIAKVQSNIKSQIAYSSVSQLGLIFVEIALGWHNLAMFHFAGNAFLRTYQLLISPSVVTYRIREQFFTLKKESRKPFFFIPTSWSNYFYWLSVREFNLDHWNYRWLWHPLKRLGRWARFISTTKGQQALFGLFILGLLVKVLVPVRGMGDSLSVYLTWACLGIALFSVARAFAMYTHIVNGWLLLVSGHFWIALGMTWNEHISTSELMFYLSGVLIAGGLGYGLLQRLMKLEGHLDIRVFHGLSKTRTSLSLGFLLCGMGIAGFPITPTFIGEDLIFSHIHEDQLLIAFLSSTIFVINGLAVIRLYARLFMGPYKNSLGNIPIMS